jgi:hypothetical protein
MDQNQQFYSSATDNTIQVGEKKNIRNKRNICKIQNIPMPMVAMLVLPIQS